MYNYYYDIIIICALYFIVCQRVLRIHMEVRFISEIVFILYYYSFDKTSHDASHRPMIRATYTYIIRKKYENERYDIITRDEDNIIS